MFDRSVLKNYDDELSRAYELASEYHAWEQIVDRDIGLEEQLSVFEKHTWEAFGMAEQMFSPSGLRLTIMQEARRRLIDWYPVYGDSGFKKTKEEGWQEALEEAADLINRIIMNIYKQV